MEKFNKCNSDCAVYLPFTQTITSPIYISSDKAAGPSGAMEHTARPNRIFLAVTIARNISCSDGDCSDGGQDGVCQDDHQHCFFPRQIKKKNSEFFSAENRKMNVHQTIVKTIMKSTNDCTRLCTAN